jgi:hypothetical protein
LHVDWVEAESVEAVLGGDLSSISNDLGLLFLEWSENGSGAELSWEVSKLVVERQGILSVVVWSQGLGSLLPDKLLALIKHVVWLGDKLELWHVLLEWNDLSSVSKRESWSSGVSDDDELLIDGVKVQVKSWGSWSSKGLDSLEALLLLVLEEHD